MQSPRPRVAGLAVVALGLTLLALEARARAHPAGTSSVNRLADFEYVGDGLFRVAYLLDFAEGPAYAEIDALDANHDGHLTPDEQTAYLARRLPPLIDAWVVLVDGQRVHPAIVASSLEVAPGEGGLETLRIAGELSVVGPHPSPDKDLTLHVHDDTFAGLPGWREIRAGEGATADGGSLFLAPVGDAADPRRTTDATFVLHTRRESRPPAPPPRSFARVAAIVAAVAALALLVAARSRRR